METNKSYANKATLGPLLLLDNPCAHTEYAIVYKTAKQTQGLISWQKYLNIYVIYHTYNISTKEQVAIENNDLDTQNSNHVQELNLHIDGAF